MKAFADLENNLANHLPADKNARILDFGCGTGRLLGFLHHKGYTNLHGADIDTAGWEELRSFTQSLTKIEDTVAYLQSVQGVYDFIIVKDVIYYFDRKTVQGIADLLRSALAPGGRIYYEIFNGATLMGPYVQYKDLGIQLILTEHSLRELITRSGLKLISIRGNAIPVTGPVSLVFVIMNFWQRLWLRLLFFCERGLDSQNPSILKRKVIAVASA